jgi:hypothetical protein
MVITTTERLLALPPSTLAQKNFSIADAAKAPHVLAQESTLPARLADLVAERSDRCARLLGGTGRDG